MNHSCASCCPCCWPCCPCCCPPACCCDPADDGAGGLTDPPPNFRRNASLTCTLELRVQVCGSVRDSAAVSHAPQRRPVRPRRVVTRRGETRRCGSELRRRGGRRLPSSDGDGAARVGTSKAVVYLARSKSALPASQLCFVSANRSTERTVGVLSFPTRPSILNLRPYLARSLHTHVSRQAVDHHLTYPPAVRLVQMKPRRGIVVLPLRTVSLAPAADRAQTAEGLHGGCNAMQ